ncbi:MAG: Crp/Fnr family transcriptional regulator [Rhodobacteraceae bacterium]|nr:Crp/Fnr family transcriptional regulator [Paracoccaceae bacterium]
MSIILQNSDKFPHLLKCSILRNLSLTQQTEFLNLCELITFPEAAEFLEQGQPSPGLFLVARGSAEVTRVSSSGQSAFMFFSEIGHCLGDIEAIAGKNCIASCIASKDTMLLFLPTKILLDYLSDLTFVRNFAAIFLERMESNNSFRTIDKHDPIDLRLRSYLHFMSGKTLTITKSQKNLANITNCSRQTINKELGKLREMGIIDVQNGAVIILDRERLAEGIDQP